MNLKKMLIALDIDGTLVDESGKISAFSAQQIATLSQQGYQICLVTGRQWISTIELYRQCNLHTLCVLCNGALVFDPISNQKLLDIVIPIQDIESFLQDEELMSCVQDMMCELDFQTFSLNGSFCWHEKQIVGSWKQNLYRAPNSLNVYAKSYEQQERLKRCVRKNPQYDYRYWYLHGEIYHVSFSKKEGVERLLSHYHKTMKDVLFIGDGVNDMELLQCVGYSVAMKNAPEEVKKVARFVTDADVKQDGAIRFLLNWLEKKSKPE